MKLLATNLRKCTDYEREHGRVVNQEFLDDIADELDRLEEELLGEIEDRAGEDL